MLGLRPVPVRYTPLRNFAFNPLLVSLTTELQLLNFVIQAVFPLSSGQPTCAL